MRNIGITTFVTLLMLGTAIIGSGHIALAYNHKFTKDFSNNGNNQEIQQDCGNSCTETSSNTINSGSGSSLTSPSPSLIPTTLTLSLQPGVTCLGEAGVCTATGFLRSNIPGPVAGATITFTGTAQLLGGGTIPIANFTPPVLTDQSGNYQVAIPSADLTAQLQSFSVTAHYAGTTTFAPSNSPTVKTVP